MAFSTIGKRGKWPKFPMTDEGINKTGIHIEWNIIQLLKVQNSKTCYNMEGPWKHHAKWNMQDKTIKTAWFHLY